MISDNLILNEDKTEFVILGTKQQLAKVDIDNIKVGSANVSPIPVQMCLTNGRGSWVVGTSRGSWVAGVGVGVGVSNINNDN